MNRMARAGAAIAIMLACTPVVAQPNKPDSMSSDTFMMVQKNRFAEMDANKDGVVTRDEASNTVAGIVGGTPSDRMVDTVFRRLDTDGDGKATTAEAEAAAAAQFSRLDSDHDNILSADQRRAGVERMRVRFRREE